MTRLTWLALAIPLAAQSPEAAEFFEKKVRPLFAEKCQQCHGPKARMAGLNLATGEGLTGLVAPGDPAASRLYQALSYSEKVKMPPAGKLAEAELEIVRAWIEQGATWPKPASSEVSKASGPKYWSFLPVSRPSPPRVKEEAWVRDPLDRFILAGLEAKGLKPAPAADKLALLRRVTLDLTGLTPSFEEIEAFRNDTSANAYEKVVERLLSSPRYGERWGRHWLDIARMADSTGMDEDNLYPHAWRYRDYVVRSFNEGVPIDRFVHEQIAGDLLPAASKEERARNLTATGLLALGPRALAQQDRLQEVYDIVDEQIDTVSKVFLGLTVSCARCHDHKFDPILTSDYYGLASIFASTRQFRNYGRPGSISFMHYEALDADEHAKYELHRRRMYAKQLEMEDALAEDSGRDSAPLRLKVGDSLQAAWAVIHTGAKPGAEAEKHGIDVRHLGKWVEWLKTAKIDKFDKATAATIAGVAAELDGEYNTAATKWDQSLDSWRTRMAKEVVQDRTLPERPKPDMEKFFGKASFNGGPMDVGETGRVRLLRQEWEQFSKTLGTEPPLVSAVVDGPSIEQRIFLRGNLNSLGEPVSKHFPVALAGENQPPVKSGSGRLELAQWLTSRENPLTARVFVNRVWMWHTGEALVRTPSNWGKTGEKPTDPDLLDHLASRFVDGGWKLPDLHRAILLSSTYRMSTHASREAREADPNNRLFSRFPRTRMSIEQIRDSFLGLSGTLDSTMGGQLLNSSGGKRQKVDADEIKRRTLYLPVRRGSIPPLLATFDFGDATTPGEARARTNVAPQALFIRNSKFAVERSREFAARLLADAALTDSQRVERAYLMALTRVPESAEVDESLSYIGSLEKRLGGEEARATAWRSFCHVLMSANEFLY